MSDLSYKLSTITLILLLITSCFMSIHGVLLLSPLGVLSVCVGMQLEITCNTTSNLQWNVTYIRDDAEAVSETRFVYHSTLTATASSFMVHQSIIHVTRTSPRNSLPLISTLLIDPVSAGLNQTVITCMQLGNPVNIEATAIIITIDQHYDLTSPPDLLISIRGNSEQFGPDNVTLIVDWTQEDSTFPFKYNVSILPQGAIMRFVESMSVELTVPYNISFNISIITSLCDQSLIPVTIYLPVYTKASLCDIPVLQPEVQATVNYSQPLIEGTVLGFTCLSGLTLSGTNSTTCLSNGQWTPNPDHVKCEVNCGPPLFSPDSYIIPYASTLEGAIVTYICCGNQSLFQATAVCTKMGYWEPSFNKVCAVQINPTDESGKSSEVLSQVGRIAVASLTIVFGVALILFFIIGYLCGHFQRKKETTHLYDNPHQEMELKTNVAYGQISI